MLQAAPGITGPRATFDSDAARRIERLRRDGVSGSVGVAHGPRANDLYTRARRAFRTFRAGDTLSAAHPVMNDDDLLIGVVDRADGVCRHSLTLTSTLNRRWMVEGSTSPIRLQ